MRRQHKTTTARAATTEPVAYLKPETTVGLGGEEAGLAPAREQRDAEMTGQVRRRSIATGAYSRGGRRGGDGESEIEDWRVAEAEIARLLDMD